MGAPEAVHKNTRRAGTVFEQGSSVEGRGPAGGLPGAEALDTRRTVFGARDPFSVSGVAPYPGPLQVLGGVRLVSWRPV